MLKKILVASLFFVISGFSILAMRGRLLYLDATISASEGNIEAKFFHLLYLAALIGYIFFTYIYFKSDPENEESHRKVVMGMAFPAYILGAFGIFAGIGCAVLGCQYGVVFNETYGVLLNLEFLDRFIGDEAKTTYKFVVKLPDIPVK